MEMEIRLLRESDLPAALRLKELAQWNQTENDWLRLLRLEPNGCFCATIKDNVVATTTTTTYQRELAWVGMVLVDPEYRQRGIATKLMKVATDYLLKARVETIKLDATPAGRLVYEHLGFQEESLIERWEGVAGSPPVERSPLDATVTSEALDLDRHAFGADRAKLIGMLFDESSVEQVVAKDSAGRLTGYALARCGTAATYVGPLVANDPNTAAFLLDGLLIQMPDQHVYIDLNTKFEEGRGILTDRGFAKQRDLIRMSYGRVSAASLSPSIFSIAGPEIG